MGFEAMIKTTFVQIEIPGEPVAKARARTVRQKGRTHSYTPAKSKNWAEAASLLAKIEMRGKQRLSGAIMLDILAIFAIPESWPEWKREAALSGLIAHTVKPDRDNIEKNVCDALNGIVWIDDCYIIDGKIKKEYGENSGIIVYAYHADKVPAQQAKRTDFI